MMNPDSQLDRSPYWRSYLQKKSRPLWSSALHLLASLMIASGILWTAGLIAKILLGQHWLLRSVFWAIVGGIFVLTVLIIHSIIDTEFSRYKS